MKINREDFRLYAVTDRAWAKDDEDFFRQIEAVIEGGVKIVQFREKHLALDPFLEDARRFTELCHRRNAVSIINDNAEAALAAKAGGVHVGQSDLEACRARDLLGPEPLVGVSVHTVGQALQAQAAGADYLGVGAAFATGTKADAVPVSQEAIRTITEAVELPVVAIGGISRENILMLKGLGLAGVAVVSALFAQADPKAAAEELLSLAKQL